MPAQLLKIIPLALLMNVSIFTGMYFISGRIFAGPLAAVYARTGFASRTVIASVTVFALGNYLGGFLMGKFSPALVAPVMMALYVLSQVVFTVAVVGYRPSWWIAPATLVVMAASAWVSALLSGS